MDIKDLYNFALRHLKVNKINRYTKIGENVSIIESLNGKMYYGYTFATASTTICSEQIATINMLSNNDYNIKNIITIDQHGDIITPCGKCREFLSQVFLNQSFNVIISKSKSILFSTLLPYDYKNEKNFNIDYKKDIENDTYNLGRFIEAQNKNYEIVKTELINEKKISHWIWYYFPIPKELSTSVRGDYYGFSTLAEAKSFIENPILKNRYNSLVNILIKSKQKNPNLIFGIKDSYKVHVSLSLFYIITKEKIYKDAIDIFYYGLINNDIKTFIEETNI